MEADALATLGLQLRAEADEWLGELLGRMVTAKSEADFRRVAEDWPEVLDPRTLRPLDEELIVQSVKKTGRVIIIEEGWPFNGVGAEIAYRIGRRC